MSEDTGTANSEYPWPTRECVQCGRTVTASRTDDQGRCAFCTPSPSQPGSDQPPPCICGHAKGDHIGRMDDCNVKGCPCPLYALGNGKHAGGPPVTRRLMDWLIPRQASEWGRLTRPWPALDVWCRANPALNDRVLPEALWAAAVDPLMPPGVVEIDGHRYPLIEFTDSGESTE